MDLTKTFHFGKKAIQQRKINEIKERLQALEGQIQTFVNSIYRHEQGKRKQGRELLKTIYYIYTNKEELFIDELEDFKNKFSLYLQQRIKIPKSTANHYIRAVKLIETHKREDLLHAEEGEKGYNSDAVEVLKRIASVQGKRNQKILLDDFSNLTRDSFQVNKQISNTIRKTAIKGIDFSYDATKGKLSLIATKEQKETLEKIVSLITDKNKIENLI